MHMVYPDGHSGWSVEFNLDRSNDAHPKDESSEQAYTNGLDDEKKVMTVTPGLHCGPAGRRTLIKWIEDNYKMRKKAHHVNPGVRACKLWQDSQGFSEPIAKAIVELLRLNGVTANVTYKDVFENHLCKLFSTLIKKSPDDRERLITLTEKMMSMFQVTQIQPLICDVLVKLDEIPQFAMIKLLDKTSSAENFFKIAPMTVKRKILAASPERLYDIVSPLIEDALFLLDLGILEDDMKETKLYTGYHKKYTHIIETIVELIGPPKTQCSKTIYFLVQQIIRVMFMRSVLTAKSSRNKIKDIEYEIGFEHVVFDSVKFHMINNEDDDPYAVYRRYAEMSVCIVYNLEKNADETVRSVSEIKCPGNGAWNLSAIRHSITVTYQEKYMLQPNEIMALEPLTSAIQLVTTITDGSTGKLPTELFHRMTKQKGQNLKIKNDMELFDLTFMLSHPLVANCILAYAIGMIKDTSDAIISLRAGMDEWLALLALGLSSHYIAAFKYFVEAELHLTGDICCTKSFLKPLKSEGKPVSLSKLVSYVYPLDKGTKHGGNDLPPFLTNITIQKTSKQGNTKDENMDSHLSFHELLLMYMPRIDISALKKFMAVCDDFYLIRETTNDIKADGTQLLRSILEAYQEPNLDPRGLIQKMSTAVENNRDTSSQKYILALEKLHGKFKFINSSVMGILTNTSNITKLFQKMVGLKIIAKGVTHKMSRPVIKPVLYEEIKKMNLVHLRQPADYLCLCLIRLGFSAMNLVEFDSLAEFIANITIQGQLAAFIPLYALAAKRGSSQEIERHINNIYGLGNQLFNNQEDYRKKELYTAAFTHIQGLYDIHETHSTMHPREQTTEHLEDPYKENIIK